MQEEHLVRGSQVPETPQHDSCDNTRRQQGPAALIRSYWVKGDGIARCHQAGSERTLVCPAHLAACAPPRALLTGCLHSMHMSSLLSLLWSKPTGLSQGEASPRLAGCCFFQCYADGKTCCGLHQALPRTVLQAFQERPCPDLRAML